MSIVLSVEDDLSRVLIRKKRKENRCQRTERAPTIVTQEGREDEGKAKRELRKPN